MAQQTLPSRVFNAGPGVKQQGFLGRAFNPNVAMVFDSSGRLIYFPPAVARSRKNICFETVVPAKFMQSQLARFRDSLKMTYEFFSGDPDLTISYYCFLRDPAKKDPFTISFDANDKAGKAVKLTRTGTGDPAFPQFLADLKAAIDKLQEYAEKENVTAEQIENDFGKFKYFPAAAFVKNLFFNQYEVQIRNGSEDIKTITLNGSYNAKEKCFRFTAGCQLLKDLACGSCGVPDAEQLSFQLVRTDPFTETLRSWFEAQNKELAEIATPNAIKNALDAIALLPDGSPVPQNTLDIFGNVKPWFIRWFWYTRGKFVIDPFEVMSDAGVKALQASIKEKEREIALLRQQKKFLDSVLAKVPLSLFRLPLFKMVQIRLGTISDNIDKLTKENENAEKRLKKKSSLFPHTQPKSFLNDAGIVLSDGKHVRPQIQFNAARKFRAVVYSKRQAHRITELPDNEEGHILVHNLDSSTKFKVDQVHKPFNDSEEFTQFLADQIDKIINAGTTEKTLKNIEQFVGDLFPPVGVPAGLKGLSPDDIAKTVVCDETTNMAPVYQGLKDLAKAYAEKRLTFVYESTVFAKKQPQDPRFRTHTEMMRYAAESPFKDSLSGVITTGTETTTKALGNINVGKLRYVQIGFGVAVVNQPITSTSIDTVGGFRVSTSDNRAKAIAGFKIYPFQNYNRDRWLLPRYPLHRLSVFAGFEVLHPLDNFYLGGAYDIVPGLAFSAGKNIYLQTSRRIENNTVTETNRSYQQAKGLYYAVTVNPVLFVKFTSLFFKSL